MGEEYRVTTVGMAPAEDRAKRMRFYYLTMGMRLVCVGSLFFVRGWWIAVALAGAVLLPYFAVMIANAVAASPDEAVDAPDPLGITGADPVAESGENAADRAADALIVIDAPGFVDPAPHEGSQSEHGEDTASAADSAASGTAASDTDESAR